MISKESIENISTDDLIKTTRKEMKELFGLLDANISNIKQLVSSAEVALKEQRKELDFYEKMLDSANSCALMIDNKPEIH